jgi:hypothetical protein
MYKCKYAGLTVVHSNAGMQVTDVLADHCTQVDIQKVWLLFSSVVLAFAFVFGNSIRQLYEAVIFLFVIHPYDVGDWLMIDGAQYQVSAPELAVSHQ